MWFEFFFFPVYVSTYLLLCSRVMALFNLGFSFCLFPLQQCCVSRKAHGKEYKQDESGTDALTMTWDSALKKGTQEYQHLSYNILTCNCHSFVANNLNRLRFRNGGWNVVNLAAMIFLKGQWVNKGAVARSLVPFIVVFGAALYFGGVTFLTFWAFFTFLLVGWFLLGTYCFRDLIHL